MTTAGHNTPRSGINRLDNHEARIANLERARPTNPHTIGDHTDVKNNQGTPDGAVPTYSHADGQYLPAVPSTVSPWQSGSGTDSAELIGQADTASGTAAVAEGHATAATANYAHAEGTGTTASAAAAHAEGNASTASGIASHSEGEAGTAFAEAAHAEGYGSQCRGFAAHCEGQMSIVDPAGLAGHAGGTFGHSWAPGHHAQGGIQLAGGHTGPAGLAQYSYVTLTGESSDASGEFLVNANGDSQIYAGGLTEALLITVFVVARQKVTDGIDASAWRLDGLMVGDGSVTFQWVGGSPTATVLFQSAGAATWDTFLYFAGTPSTNFGIWTSGEVGKTIEWIATIHMHEIA